MRAILKRTGTIKALRAHRTPAVLQAQPPPQKNRNYLYLFVAPQSSSRVRPPRSRGGWPVAAPALTVLVASHYPYAGTDKGAARPGAILSSARITLASYVSRRLC